MKNLKVAFGCAALVCAGCTSDPEGFTKAMDVLGTAATIAIEASQPPPPPPPPPVVVHQPVVVAQPVVVQQPVVTQPVVVQQPVMVQQPVVAQPVVQQPVVQAPAVQQQPVAAPPAVQAPAAAAPAVAVPAADVAAFAKARTTAADTAEPEFKYGSLRFSKPATPEQIAAAKQKIDEAGMSTQNVRLQFSKVDDATVAAAIAQFPSATEVSVSGSQLSTLAPFALLSNATKLAIKDVKNLDIAPLAALRKIRSLDFTYSEIADLSPLAGMTELADIEFYGSKLKDFSPLAACPKLDRVYFYAAELPPEGYASLGALKQVKKFHGGLTKMTSIEWLRQVPQAEEVKIFAEKIPDLSPIASLPNLTYLRLWNMDGGNLSTPVGDLAFLANNKKLKKLELPGSRYVNTAALAALTALEVVDLSGAKEPVSVAFAAKLPALKTLDLNGATVTDGAVVASLPKTVRVRTNKKTQGVPVSAP
ncbi:MAG: hypothetical protein IJ146_11080 [Kiritimatiellae bacterium]|nr:hypothetical protein [Kiritimatiellia bacterium]